MSFHTAIAEDRLLALDILLELLQDVAWQTRIDLWYMHDGAAPHFLPLSSGMLERVYGTMVYDEVDEEHGLLIPDWYLLDFLRLGTYKVDSLC